MKNVLTYGAIGVLIVIIVFCFTRPAQADSLNLSYVNTSYDYSFPATVVFDDSSNGISFTYGFDINPNWAIDFTYYNLGSADQTVLFIDTSIEAMAVSVAMHGSMTVAAIAGHPIKLHGLAGLIRAEMDASIGGFTASDNDTGLLVGAGASIWLDPDQAITLMYKKANLRFDNAIAFDYDPSMLELGYTYRF